MKFNIVFIILLIFCGCKSNHSELLEDDGNYSFFVGTYTDMESQGIYKYALQKDGLLKRIGLAVKSVNPSYLAMNADKQFLLAVNEINEENEGTIESFSITDDSLTLISRSTSGGAHPCFVSIDKSGFVLTANYTGGNVGLLRLNPQGELTPLLDVQQHSGSGTTERQEAPHAHSAWFNPTNNIVVSVDLGTNQLWFSHLDTVHQKLIPSNPNKLTMKPGAGPRHLAFHPNGSWIYVVNELDCTVVMVNKTGNQEYIQRFSISTLPAGFSEPNTCADIGISSNGNFLYVSNRGHNSIAIFNVDNQDGSLKLLSHELTRGDGPRNFSLSPDEEYLLVANQHTNNIVSFKRTKSTGLLTYVAQIEAPTPVCILF